MITPSQAQLAAMLARPQYMVLTHFGTLGLGNGNDPVETFAEAVDSFIHNMSRGCESRVFRVDFVGCSLAEVTSDAIAEAAARFDADGDGLPEWVEAA